MEIWKDVKGYEGIYQVSNLGRVKSLERVIDWNNTKKPIKERLLKPSIDSNYLRVGLCRENKLKSFKIHKLVAIAFLYHSPKGHKEVVDHIDNNKLNNRLDNLQLITNRENCSKDTNGSSNYIGVCWDKSKNKWLSQIQINGKNKFLGRFNTEIEASQAYQSCIEKIGF
jgi:hypothetical protein